MMINISELISKKITKKSISTELDVKKFSDSFEEYYIIEPLKVTGTLDIVGDVLYLDGVVEGKIQLTCSRCLQKFNYDLKLDIHEKLTNNPENKDDELIFINNDKLDLTEIIENNIIMSLPIQRLCKEDCKGLCVTCGTNFNLSTCNCEKNEIDPRLAKLKDLFSNH